MVKMLNGRNFATSLIKITYSCKTVFSTETKDFCLDETLSYEFLRVNDQKFPILNTCSGVAKVGRTG